MLFLRISGIFFCNRCIEYKIMRLKSILLAIVAVLTVFSCAEKDEFKLQTDQILHFGEHYEFQLTREIKDLKEPRITCVLKDESGNIFERDAFVNIKDSIATVGFMQGVAEGRFLLLSLDFVPDDDEWKGKKKSIGVGRYLEARDGKINVTGSYSVKYGYGGAGTKEDPYKICTDSDMYSLMGAVNTAGRRIPFVGEYFVQEQNIDMDFYSEYVNAEYGWLPIGESAATPFAGSYDGNGYEISNLWLSRNLQSGVGLFGVLYNGIVKNVKLVNARIIGDGAVGGVVGSVIGDGEVAGVSLVQNCTISGCTVSGNVGVGGIVGMVDKNVRLQIDACITDSGSMISCNDQAVGGILGGAVTMSSVYFISCTNNANIYPKSVVGGGIAGGVDTVTVISCSNFGNVEGSLQNSQSYAIGGILGGSGVANIVNAQNKGKVQGYKGVGGIVGSSLITVADDGSGAVYNNVFIQSSVNHGEIHGNQMVGGLCGEAQIAVFKAYNKGNVTADSDYAGGIFGSSSVAAIHCCANFGQITGYKNVGGIGGKVQEGTFALNTNLGDVYAYNNWAGGIFGKVGNQSIIHYCGNYGAITLDQDSADDDSNIGGIAGEIGNPREWSGWDIAEVVIGAAEIVTGVIGCAAFTTAVGLGLEAAEHTIHVVHILADITLLLAETVTIGYSGNLLNFPPDQDYVGKSKIIVDSVKLACARNYEEMESLVNSAISAAKFSAGDLRLSTEPMDALKQNRTAQLDFYTKDTINHKFFNERLNEARIERYHQVEEDKHSRELAHTIVQGVCMGLTIVGMLVGAVATGGFSVIVGLGTMTVAVAGGLNSITKAVGNYDVNTLEISQSFNYGKITAPGRANAAGIVGRMADYSKVADCLNAGTITNGYSIVEVAGGEPTIQNSLNLYGDEPLAIIDNHKGNFSTIENNRVYCNALTEDEWEKESYNYSLYFLEEREDILIPSTVCKAESYSGWDLEKKWKLKNGGTQGMYPVPNVSIMTYESGGHH